MSKITVELTPAQEKFLKLFAKNHYPGASDNLATDIPIHVVQSEEYDYIPVDDEYAEAEPENLSFSSCMFSCNKRFNTPEELVSAYYKGEECPAEILPYKDVKDETIIGVDGEEHYIYSHSRYFEAYGIDGYGIEGVSRHWSNIAFFFINKEAHRYMEYQKHNLHNPRIFSYAPGYANDGEYRHFYELLRSMGNKLLETDETRESD